MIHLITLLMAALFGTGAPPRQQPSFNCAKAVHPLEKTICKSDTLALLEEHWKPTGLGGIMHCFSGSPSEAERCIALGFHLSFGGIITFPKSAGVQAAAAQAPANRILIETDAPYLAPVPHRGKRNEPAFVAETARKLAQLRGVTPEEIAQLTTTNFLGLLG